MFTSADELTFRRALALARSGRGITEPNPSVGCVLIRDGITLGEGRSQAAGGVHAEPTAIADAKRRGHDTRAATAYVTLEPCSHVNKRTPPCVPSVIAAGITRVVVGCLDPNPAVNGDGIRQLTEAGVIVQRVPPDLEAESKQQVAAFTARTIFERPYITLKYAATADGYIAGPGGAPIRITSKVGNDVVHGLRARSDAIAVGGQTVRTDNPALTVRAPALPRSGKQPVRVIFARDRNLPSTARLLTDGGETVTFSVITDPRFEHAFADLVKRGISHLLVESGGELARALIAANVVDRVWTFHSDTPLNHPGIADAVSSLVANWPTTATTRLGPDTLTERLNPRSNLFYAAVPSADFEQLTTSAASTGVA